MNIPNCADCKNFNEHANPKYQHVGWCDLQLPKWLLRASPDISECEKIVRRDDSCSFFEGAK